MLNFSSSDFIAMLNFSSVEFVVLLQVFSDFVALQFSISDLVAVLNLFVCSHSVAVLQFFAIADFTVPGLIMAVLSGVDFIPQVFGIKNVIGVMELAATRK